MKLNIKSKRNRLFILGSLTAIVTLAILTFFTGQPSNNTAINTTDTGELIINKSDITKTASFYPYESNGTYMEIIAVQANDGTVRTALNTCQVCYGSGRGYYEQLGDELICNNCGNRFTIDQIQLVKGGCNPVPITNEMKTEDINEIIIDPVALAVYEPFFEYWKR